MYPSKNLKIVKAEDSKTFLQTEDPEEQVAEFSLSSKTHSDVTSSPNTVKSEAPRSNRVTRSKRVDSLSSSLVSFQVLSGQGDTQPH